MLENKDMPAFPQSCSANENGIYLATSANVNDNAQVIGFTKREQIAAMALQGLMAVNNKGQFDSPEYCLNEAARLSVIAADALLLELSKP